MWRPDPRRAAALGTKQGVVGEGPGCSQPCLIAQVDVRPVEIEEVF